MTRLLGEHHVPFRTGKLRDLSREEGNDIADFADGPTTSFRRLSINECLLRINEK